MPKNCLEDKTEKKDSQQKSLFLEKARQGMEITALCFFVCSVNYLKLSNKSINIHVPVQQFHATNILYVFVESYESNNHNRHGYISMIHSWSKLSLNVK